MAVILVLNLMVAVKLDHALNGLKHLNLRPNKIDC